jgi:hypothetical protein
VDGATVLQRFASAFVDEAPDFQIVCAVDVEAMSSNGTDTASIVLDGGVSGDDFTGSLTLTSPGLTLEADAIFVNGEIYVRPKGGDWTPGEEYEQTEPLNPFEGAAANFSYVGPEVRDGRTLHHLSLDQWTGKDVLRKLRKAGFRRPEVQAGAFDVYVGDDGIPVSGGLDFTIAAVYLGEHVVFAYGVAYEFSDVGKPVIVEEPI